jgi:tRNA pseudouridine38-40 synthase
MARRRIRIDLTYDGTDFCGWQWQERQRSVQGTVEAALTRLAGERPVRLRAASRTDSGVHARQQVSDCLIDCRLNDDDLAHALGKMLPQDVRPTRVRTVADDFSSMHHARRKTYRYRLDRSRHGDPFLARFALHHPHALDEGLIREGGRRLLGKHDWSGFADSRCTIDNRVREMSEAGYEESGTAGCFVFTADGFLTYMVRNLVGTLIEIGAGRMAPEEIERILDSGDRRLAAATAPAHGLCLWRIVYSDDTTETAEPYPAEESWRKFW